MEVIAERILTLELTSSTSVPIRVLLGKPEQSHPDEWITPYEIHGPGGQPTCGEPTPPEPTRCNRSCLPCSSCLTSWKRGSPPWAA